MGLDIYFKYLDAVSETENINDENFTREAKTIIDLRGHWQMQKFMEKIYKERGQKRDLSCYKLVLTRKNMEDFKEAVKNFELPKIEIYRNFYHSEDEYAKMSYDHVKMFRELERTQYKEDIKLADDCIKLIDEGKIVYYWSWW